MSRVSESLTATISQQDAHILHPMTAPALSAQQTPMVISRGEGVYVFDSQGNRYLDSQGGLWCVNVGHNRREMNQAIQVQLEKIAYYTSFVDFTNEPAMELSQKLINMLQPENMSKVMFSSGGSDANETALKLARQYWRLQGQPERTKFFSLKNAYHGVHFGTTSVTGTEVHQYAYEPLLAGCYRIDSPWLYRNPWTADPQELGAIVAAMLEREILHHGPHTIAAFIAEPVQGAGGVIVPPANFWPLVREVCNKYDVLLIADEVVTGFGRSGNMFGARGWGVAPDIMTFAKGLTSGYIPLGATVLNERVASAWNTLSPQSFIMHGYTYSGHPVACAAGIAALTLVEQENLPANAAAVGEYCLQQLQPFAEQYPSVGEVRGKGLMLAIDLVEDKNSRLSIAPTSPLPKKIAIAAQRAGVIVRNVGPKIIISPPLIFETSHVDELVDALHAAFDEVDRH